MKAISTSRCQIESLEARQLLAGSVGVGSATGITITPPVIPPIVQPIGTGAGVTIHTEATDQFNGTVGLLKNFVLPPLTTPAQPALLGLQISINWGDGSKPSTGTLASTSVAKQFAVKGSHTYAKVGTFKVTVTVAWGPLPGSGIMTPTTLLATIHSTAIVMADEDGGVTLNEKAGKSFTAEIGSFDFRTVDIILGTVKIDWGDGTNGVGSVKGTGGLASGEYDVFGSHTYLKAGTYKVHVIVTTHLVGQTKPTGKAADFYTTIKVAAPTT